MHRTLGGLALLGVILLCGCDSPHRAAEMESLRSQIKEQQKLVNELQGVIEGGDKKFVDIIKTNEELEAKLRDAVADLDDANRKSQLEILALKVALEKATGKSPDEKPAPEKPSEEKPESKPDEDKKKDEDKEAKP